MTFINLIFTLAVILNAVKNPVALPGKSLPIGVGILRNTFEREPF